MKVNHIITLSSRMISKSRGPHQREGPSQDVPGCRRSCGGNPHKSPMVVGSNSKKHQMSRCVKKKKWISLNINPLWLPCWELGHFVMLYHLWRRLQAKVGQPTLSTVYWALQQWIAKILKITKSLDGGMEFELTPNLLNCDIRAVPPKKSSSSSTIVVVKSLSACTQ